MTLTANGVELDWCQACIDEAVQVERERCMDIVLDAMQLAMASTDSNAAVGKMRIATERMSKAIMEPDSDAERGKQRDG